MKNQINTFPNTYTLKKEAGYFKDDNGNWTTGAKVGAGLLGLGAAGALGYNLANSAEDVPEIVKQTPYELHGGASEVLNNAKESIVNAGKTVAGAGKAAYNFVRGVPTTLSPMAKDFWHGDQEVMDILKAAKDPTEGLKRNIAKRILNNTNFLKKLTDIGE